VVVEQNGQKSNMAEPPLGIFTAKCDEKGRLKLPAEFVAYLKALGEDTVFITTLDMKLARIYPKGTWQHNQNLLENAGDDAEIAEDVGFLVNHYGAAAEIDGNGRVLLPTNLRRELELENQTVWLDYFNGGFNAFGKKIFDERMNRATVNLGDKVKALRKKGLK
jgi:DNA-binding transcriptional regulator/RsmH inhibitor MraZ